jgi:hypothetical protein
MALTTTQGTSYNALGTAANTLNDKLVAFATAKTAYDSAAAALATATTALDAAWTDYKAKDAAFDGVMLVAPMGYTPPA